VDKIVSGILANRKSLLFVCLIALAYSVAAIAGLRQAVFPDVSFPSATFSIDNGFAPLTEMETVYGRPVETLAGSSVGVVTYQSKIQRGLAEVTVQFDAARNFQSDYQILKGKVASLVQSAPTSSGTPATLTSNLTNSNNLALLGYSLVSPSANYLDLRQVVDTRIVPALQQVNGVGTIEVIGGSLPEVRIALKPAALEQFRMSPAAISAQIKDAATTRFLGTFVDYGKLILGFSPSKATNADQIAALHIDTGAGTVPLSQLADVRMAASEPGVLTTTDRKKSVLFNVYGAPGVDVVSLSSEVGAVVYNLQTTLPKTMEISRWYSLSDFIQTSLGNVTKAILIGVLIVSFSILAFLRSWRAAVPVVSAMLVTLLLTFIFIDALGFTLNIMTLAGISAAVGLIVDDAIVAVENIARLLQEGLPRRQAVVQGATEVFSPLLSSTLTTAAVFAPLGLLTGITGFLFKASSVVIVVSLLISLIMAVTLAPILSDALLRDTSHPRKSGQLGPVKSTYHRFLRLTLRAPLIVSLAAAVLVGSSLVVARGLPTAYLPQWDEGTFVMDMDTSAGTSKQEMERLVSEVETVIASMPEIQTYSRAIADSALRTNQAHFFMHPKPAGAGGPSVFTVMGDLENKLLTQFPNLNIDLHQILPDHFDGLSGKNNVVAVDVFGGNLTDLLASADIVSTAVGKLPGISEVKMKAPEFVTQFDLTLDTAKLALHGIGRSAALDQVKLALYGSTVSYVSVGDQRAKVRLTLPEKWRNFHPSLKDMPLVGSSGNVIPLSAVGEITLRQSPDRVTRKQGHLAITLQAKTDTADLGGNATRIAAEIQKLSLPSGSYAIVSGDWKRQVQAFNQLRNVFLMAMGLVFTLLLIFFRSYGQSLLIMLNTLISLSFVIFGVKFFNTSFNVPTFMGLISVMGIVVKNGILVMAFLNSNLAHGENALDAIVDACMTRARPILMTSVAAILGFMPMALSAGRGGEMMQPFAAAVIYGVIGGVLSSLIVLPSLYTVGHRIFRRKPS